MGGLISKITGNKMILGATVGIVGGLIVAIILVVVVGVGRSAPAEATKDASGKVVAAPKATPKKADPKAAAAKFGPTYAVRDRIVNLADPGGRRYLRFSVAIEFEGCSEEHAAAPGGSNRLVVYEPEIDRAEYQPVTGGGKDTDKEFQAQIKKYAPAIEDIVTVVLSGKTYGEVQTIEGKDAAKKEISDRLNRLLESEPVPDPAPATCVIHYPPHVSNVYFNEFVIQ